MKSKKHSFPVERFNDDELTNSFKILGLDDQFESTIYFDTPGDDMEDELFI